MDRVFLLQVFTYKQCILQLKHMVKSNKADQTKKGGSPEKSRKIEKKQPQIKEDELKPLQIEIRPLQTLTKTQLGRLYRIYSRRKYNKYYHQFPRMRDSQRVSKIIREWQALDMKEKFDLFHGEMHEEMISDDESVAKSQHSDCSAKKKKKKGAFINVISYIDMKDLNNAAKKVRISTYSDLQSHYSLGNPHDFKDFLEITQNFVRQRLIKNGVPIAGKHDRVDQVESIVAEIAEDAMHKFNAQRPLDFKLQRLHRKNIRKFDEDSGKEEHEKQQIIPNDSEDSDFERDQKRNFQVPESEEESQIGVRHNYDHMKIARVTHGIKIINQTLKVIDPKHIDLKLGQTYERIVDFSQDYALNGDRFWTIGPALAGNNRVAMGNECKTCNEIFFDERKLINHQKLHYNQFKPALQMLVSQKCNTTKFFVVIKTKQRDQIIFGLNGINWEYTELKLVVDEKRYAIAQCEKMAAHDSQKSTYHVVSVARNGCESLQRSCQGMSQQQLQNENKRSIGGNHILTKVARWSPLDMKTKYSIELGSAKSYSFFHLKHVHIPTVTCMYLKAANQSVWRAFPYIGMMGLPDAIRRVQMLDKYLVDQNPHARMYAKQTLQWIYHGIGSMPGLSWAPWFRRQISQIQTLHFKELLTVDRDFVGDIVLQKTKIQFKKQIDINLDGFESSTLISNKDAILRILRNNCIKMFAEGIYFSQDKAQIDEEVMMEKVDASQSGKTSVVMWNRDTAKYFLIGSGGKEEITEQEYRSMLDKKFVGSTERITYIDDDEIVLEVSITLRGLIWKEFESEDPIQ